jgi:vancomycin permeability regulator SanA
MRKILKLILIFTILLAIINFYIISTTKRRIIEISNIEDKDYDCIVVLGAGIRNNKPSPMLEDRLLTAIELYNNKAAPKILVSGDHEYKDYDEVNVMKNYLKENGIPSEDIFMDHAGLSSYDSIYRTKKIFKADKVIIVTQKYHLYRSLYIAKSIDLNAYGVSATKREYMNQTKRDIREIAARIKDFLKCLIKPEPTYLGEVIPIKGNGDRTDDNK